MKCVGVAKLSKTAHMRYSSVQSEKLLCAECAGVPKLAAHKYSGNTQFRTSFSGVPLSTIVQQKKIKGS